MRCRGDGRVETEVAEDEINEERGAEEVGKPPSFFFPE